MIYVPPTCYFYLSLLPLITFSMLCSPIRQCYWNESWLVYVINTRHNLCFVQQSEIDDLYSTNDTVDGKEMMREIK